MNRRLIDWIWHVRGNLALAPEQSASDALDRLDPLFRQSGTTHDRTNDTLTFRKRDQAAQDKLAIFDGGVLKIERRAAGSVLHYHLTSRALLFCFIAPLLFLAIAQLTLVLNRLDGPAVDAAKKHKKPDVVLPMNPIDKFLGAPAPEKPGKKKADKPGGRDKKPTPTAAYVFAALFLALYVVGRILESRLIRRTFREHLMLS